MLPHEKMLHASTNLEEDNGFTDPKPDSTLTLDFSITCTNTFVFFINYSMSSVLFGDTKQIKTRRIDDLIHSMLLSFMSCLWVVEKLTHR
jgi:hypothetical protein